MEILFLERLISEMKWKPEREERTGPKIEQPDKLHTWRLGTTKDSDVDQSLFPEDKVKSI